MGAEEVEVDRRFEENKLLKSVRPFRLSLSSLLRRIFVTRVGLVWSVSAQGDAVCVCCLDLLVWSGTKSTPMLFSKLMPC